MEEEYFFFGLFFGTDIEEQGSQMAHSNATWVLGQIWEIGP